MSEDQPKRDQTTTIETVTVPADDLLDLLMAHEAEFGKVGGYFGRLLDANRTRATDWHHPLGYVEHLDGPRSPKSAIKEVPYE